MDERHLSPSGVIMGDYMWEGRRFLNSLRDLPQAFGTSGRGLQTRAQVAVLLLTLLLTSCIQEAKWTWSGDAPAGDVAADLVTGDGRGEVSPRRTGWGGHRRSIP